MWIEAIFGTVAVVTFIFHWCVSHRNPKQAAGFDRRIKAENVLIAIAHPDDECLFFAPTIIGLIASGCNVHLLCLSSGNHRGLGLLRKVELRHSCRVLGMNIGNIVVVEHSSLPDDPTLVWSKRIVRQILLKYCTHLKVDTVITFDRHGVSGHLNHCALFAALEHLNRKGMLSPGTRVFTLQTVNIVRKYAGMFDILTSHVDESTHIYVSSYMGIFRAWRAMLQHRTQLVWFRYLYMLFSRYMIMNTLRRMTDDYYVDRSRPGSKLSRPQSPSDSFVSSITSNEI